MIRLKQDDSLHRIKIEKQEDKIYHLNHAKKQLTAEIETLGQKHEYRRDLVADLSTELCLTVSTRESILKQELNESFIEEEVIKSNEALLYSR
jgi:hypothetical protein